MTALPTLNVSAEQIERDLRAGKTVDDICTEWQEPRGNVLGVLRAMQARGDGAATKTPAAPVAATTRPDLTVMRADARQIVQPRPEFKERATNAVELLARADSIDDRRVQAALGRARKAMTDLAGLVKKYEESHATRVRIAELEAELRALRSAGRGGAGTVQSRPDSTTTAARGVDQRLPCTKGCGRTSANPQGRAAHERHCTGAS